MIDKQILESLAAKGLSTQNIADALGSSRSAVRRALSHHDLHTVHQPGPPKSASRQLCKGCGLETINLHYCSLVCQAQTRTKEKVKKWYADQSSVIATNGGTIQWLKKYLRKKQGNQCCLCGWCEVNSTTGIVPIELDHIDGNWRNNVETNLRLLCPNCHSLTSTYKGLNKGKGRPFVTRYAQVP